MQPKEAVEFKTYKKDRSVLLYLGENAQYQIVERGFEDNIYDVDAGNVLKQMKKSLATEFPSNRKAWVKHYHNIEDPLDIKRKHTSQYPLLLPSTSE
ncbi:hypothetical protein ACVBIL_15865 [Shewanella sp. 125m-7]